MSVRAAKHNLAAAVLNTFGPAYSRSKNTMLPAERAAVDAAVRYSLKYLHDNPKPILLEHDAEIERRRAAAANARFKRSAITPIPPIPPMKGA